MYSVPQRKLLFLLGCIPTRLLLVYVAYSLPEDYLPYFGLLLLIPALSFLILYLFRLRLDAPEGGGHTWWNDMRPLHGILYLVAAIGSFMKTSWIWKPLLGDVLLGLAAFIHFHYTPLKM